MANIHSSKQWNFLSNTRVYCGRLYSLQQTSIFFLKFIWTEGKKKKKKHSAMSSTCVWHQAMSFRSVAIFTDKALAAPHSYSCHSFKEIRFETHHIWHLGNFHCRVTFVRFLIPCLHLPVHTCKMKNHARKRCATSSDYWQRVPVLFKHERQKQHSSTCHLHEEIYDKDQGLTWST